MLHLERVRAGAATELAALGRGNSFPAGLLVVVFLKVCWALLFSSCIVHSATGVDKVLWLSRVGPHSILLLLLDGSHETFLHFKALKLVTHRRVCYQRRHFASKTRTRTFIDSS